MDAELAEISDFLAAHAPYDLLPPDVLAELPRRMSVRYVRRGAKVLDLGQTNDVVSIVRSGALDIVNEQGQLVERADEGTTIGNSNVLSGTRVQYDVTAHEDTLLLDMPGAAFLDLVRANEGFSRFFVQLLAARIRGAVEEVSGVAGGGAILKTHVRDMIRRAPVSTQVGTTVRDAAQVMADDNVSALLVMDGDRMAGIVTDRDLRRRVVAAGLDTSRPVADVMSPQPSTIGGDALAFEVLLEMMAHGVHHLPVIEDGRPIGVVTSTDVIRLERGNALLLAREIGRQKDVDGLVASARRLPAVVDQLVGQDATAQDIGRVVTAVGDALARRLIDLAITDLGAPPAAYCWVVLGSQARTEQGLASDQDHALILDDDLPDGAQEYFAELAERVVAGLEACGYPRCQGGVMASNPRWRQPLSAWRTDFRRWMAEPEPEAILNASIFFDMRPIHGDVALHRDIAEYVAGTAPGSSLFLGHLAKMAVAHEPPLGFFRGFVLQREGENRDTLDLKWGGIGAVVELARVLGLSTGTPAVSTQARIAAAGGAGKLSGERAADLTDAFEFISYVRLRHQARLVHEGRAPDNHVNPDDLSSFERRHLRDAFAIVRSTQQLLTQIYPLHYMS